MKWCRWQKFQLLGNIWGSFSQIPSHIVTYYTENGFNPNLSLNLVWIHALLSLTLFMVQLYYFFFEATVNSRKKNYTTYTKELKAINSFNSSPLLGNFKHFWDIEFLLHSQLLIFASFFFFKLLWYRLRFCWKVEKCPIDLICLYINLELVTVIHSILL